MQTHFSHVRNAHRCRPRGHAHVFAATSWGWELCLEFQTRSFVLSRRCFLSQLARFLCAVPLRQPARCWTTCSSCAASRPCCKPKYVHRLASSSPFGASGRVAPVTAELWRTHCNLAVARLRLRWNSRRRGVHVPPSSRQLVCALQVPVSCARSHPRARAHRPDVARQTSGTPRGAQAKNLVLRRQPRRPRSGLRGPLLLKASQLRPSASCIRVSQCVPVDRLVVVAILGKPCRRAVARHLAHQLATFAADMATSSSNCSIRVSRCRS